MAMGLLTEGPNPPDVISPMDVRPSSVKIAVWALAGPLVPVIPTLFRVTGWVAWDLLWSSVHVCMREGGTGEASDKRLEVMKQGVR